MTTKRRALLSVYRKEGIVDLARGLVARGFEIVSSGGTADELTKAGVKVLGVSTVTGFPEILDGRVKTLHPLVHGGILARRDVESHLAALEKHGIAPVDVVVVNLYPFEDKVAKGASFEVAVENVDIGGPALLRAAAKNFAHVAVVVDPADYALLLEQVDRDGGVDLASRLYFAQKAFRHTARYEAAIASYFSAARGARGSLRAGRLRGGVARAPRARVREAPGPALRREPAPARCAVRRPGIDPLLRRLGAASSRARSCRSTTSSTSTPPGASRRRSRSRRASSSSTRTHAERRSAQGRAKPSTARGSAIPSRRFGGIIAFNRKLDPATAKKIAGVLR